MKLLLRFYCLVFLGFFVAVVCEPLMAQEIDARLETKQQDDGSVVFSVTNNEAVPVFVAVHFTQLDGLVADRDAPIVIPLEVGENEGVLALRRKENARRQTYRVSYHFLFVNPAEVQPDGFLYYLPFEHGVKHVITQGWHGSFSHSGQNTYAVDFDMLEGEKVYAAREGVVVAVKRDSRIGGTSQAYAKHANYVLIRHADNTIASYVHLMFNGALVDVGQRVVLGQHIGYAGKTGFASGAHLHFDVRASTFDRGMQSVRFSFRDKDGAAVEPQAYATYYGRFPGGADFTELRGSDISAATFEDHSVELASTTAFDGLHIRKETYDSVVVLFIANAFSYAVDARVTLTLGNLRMEQSMPIGVVIPARREVFLGIARIQNARKGIAVRSSIRYNRAQE